MSHNTALNSVRNRLSDTILTGASRRTLAMFCNNSNKCILSGHATSHCSNIRVIMYSLLNYSEIMLHDYAQPRQLTHTR